MIDIAEKPHFVVVIQSDKIPAQKEIFIKVFPLLQVILQFFSEALYLIVDIYSSSHIDVCIFEKVF